MYDIEKLKADIDLREFAARFAPLKAKSRGGKELTGSCPICGGTDRFNVQKDRWLCRKCTAGKWCDVIALAGHVWRLDDKIPADFIEICRRLDADETSDFIPQGRDYLDLEQDAPPSSDWIERALAVMEKGQTVLWSGHHSNVLDWLNTRKLKAETIQRFKLGYNPKSRNIAGHWVYGGLIIPHWDGEAMWGIKIRLSAEGARTFCQIHHTEHAPKYILVKGSKPNVYNVSSLIDRKSAFVVEGELDSMLLDQEIRDQAGVITLGSASNQLSDRWLPMLLSVHRFFLCLDNDWAGQQSQAIWRQLVGNRAEIVSLPAGVKDVGDYAKVRNDLRGWALERMGILDQPRPYKIVCFDPTRLHNIMPPQFRRLPTGEVECVYNSEQEMREHIHTVALVREAISWGGVLTETTPEIFSLRKCEAQR